MTANRAIKATRLKEGSAKLWPQRIKTSLGHSFAPEGLAFEAAKHLASLELSRLSYSKRASALRAEFNLETRNAR